MTHIFYLTVDKFHEYMPNVPPGPLNPGGGVSDKTINVLEAWRKFYRVEVGQDIHKCQNAEILVVEPMWFKMRGGLRDMMTAPSMEEAVRQYEQYPCEFKVLYMSEFAFSKFPKMYRDRIIDASTVITSNCEYQERFYSLLGIHTVRLCDPVHDEFNASSEKELSVFAMGRISSSKNSQKTVEIFRALKQYSVPTVYIGDAALWGNKWNDDHKIEQEMKEVVDEYYQNMARLPLAKKLNSLSYGIFDTFHDSCSASNISALMSGVQCYYGLHGCWQDRPGVHGCDTVSDFVDALASSTKGFTMLPDKAQIESYRKWALGNYSQHRFLEDWSELLKYARYNKESIPTTIVA